MIGRNLLMCSFSFSSFPHTPSSAHLECFLPEKEQNVEFFYLTIGKFLDCVLCAL